MERAVVAVWFNHSTPGRFPGERGVYNTYVLRIEDPAGELQNLTEKYLKSWDRLHERPESWWRRVRCKGLKQKALKRALACLKARPRPNVTVSVSSSDEHVPSSPWPYIGKLREMILFGGTSQFWILKDQQLKDFREAVKADKQD